MVIIDVQDANQCAVTSAKEKHTCIMGVTGQDSCCVSMTSKSHNHIVHSRCGVIGVFLVDCADNARIEYAPN